MHDLEGEVRGEVAMAELSLKHVYMWKEGGAVKVEPEDAQKMHPYGYGHEGKKFFCHLCDQYVDFRRETNNGNRKIRCHFKHARNNKLSKECEDRSKSNGNNSDYAFKPEKYYLPIRIKINQSETDFALEIGLPPLPKSEFFSTSDFKIVISQSRLSAKYDLIIGNREQLNFKECSNYEYMAWRLQDSGRTYFSVGSNPLDYYSIQILPNSHPYNKIIPKLVDGIKTFTIFDAQSNKRIPNNSYINTNAKYIVTARTHNSFPESCTINKHFIAQSSRWHVYEIEINKADIEAGRFFLDRGYRLDAKSVHIHPLWPVTVRAPHVLLHPKDEIVLYVQGDVGIKSFPITTLRYLNPIRRNPKNQYFEVIQFTPDDRNQLVALGRLHVLKYMYLWDDDLKIEGNSPVCVVQTDDKFEVQSGEHNELPPKRRMTISITVNGIQVDGFVEIRRNNVVVRKQVIKSDGRNDIEELNYGDCVQVYSGLDKIWECTFACKSAEKHIGDEALYQELILCRGRTVDAPHALGALAAKLKDYPKTLQWLRRCIREGRITLSAIKVLCANLNMGE